MADPQAYAMSALRQRDDNRAPGDTVLGGAAAAGFQDVYYTSRDGLRLHARRYGSPTVDRPTIVCLPGLTRNVWDFHVLAQHLSTFGPDRRQVYSIDYRGRGASQWDANWKNYTPLVEAHDVLDFLTLAGLSDVVVIGTSRGGIVGMLMAALRPRSVSAMVLNDIGPTIETLGLMRIAGYVGRMPLPASWDEATAIVKELNRRQFPSIPDAEWAEVAKALFEDLAGVPGPAYDPQLSLTLIGAGRGDRAPDLWPHFRGLGNRPVLVLRGEHSDLLSQETVQRMQNVHPNLTAATIPGQGHAPLLRDRASLDLVCRFLDLSLQSVARPAPAKMRAVA